MNKDKLKYHNNYYYENKEKIRQYQKLYYQKNQDHIRKKQNKYHHDNYYSKNKSYFQDNYLKKRQSILDKANYKAAYGNQIVKFNNQDKFIISFK